jgi:NAD-dependent deacetylase sirtuin 2
MAASIVVAFFLRVLTVLLLQALFGGGIEAFNQKHGGLCKSDIVFFGEALPKRFFETLEEDFHNADLLLVVGTSLAVQPFASLVDLGKPVMPRVLINKERVGDKSKGGSFDFSPGAYTPRDVFLPGEADDSIAEIVEAAGWELPSPRGPALTSNL